MGCERSSANKEKNVMEYRPPDDEPDDLANRLYEEWRDEKLMAEAAEA